MTPQIIRTVDELEALDPKAAVLLSTGLVTHAAGARVHVNVRPLLPAVVVATGAQVRAARKALQEATDDQWNLPAHRTEAGYPNCSTCDGGGCLDCTDPA